MIALHVTSVYTLPALDRDTLAAQVDGLEDALMSLEESDPSVTDSTVSVDYARNRVEVEVYTTAETFDEAAQRAHARIEAAVGLMRYSSGNLTERREELVA